MSKATRLLDTARGRVADLQVEVVNGDGTFGLLGLASSAEVATGTSDQLAVTPKGLSDLAAGFIPAASTTVQGKVELATNAEAITGTDTARAVTPAALAAAATTHVAAASDTVAGKVELATDAESIAVTSTSLAVTPHGLGAALAKLFVISFTGSNLAGPCTAAGVALGDVIFGVAGLTSVGQMDAKFEGVVSVVDQIQQTAAENLSAANFLALVYRPA